MRLGIDALRISTGRREVGLSCPLLVRSGVEATRLREFSGNYSRFGASNSRLGLRRESPGKALVCFTIFTAEQCERGESRQNSRFYGNTGNLPAVAAALAVVGAD